jgi:uncharacterized protein (DUF433 family)
MSTRLDRIASDPAVCGGRPCIKGTRMRVRDVLDLLAAGASRQEILDDYPYIKDEDITAALEYAAQQTDHVVIAGE